jgi:hypothetical protein
LNTGLKYPFENSTQENKLAQQGKIIKALMVVS